MLEKFPEDKNNTFNYFFKNQIKIFKYFNQKEKIFPRGLYKNPIEIIGLYIE